VDRPILSIEVMNDTTIPGFTASASLLSIPGGRWRPVTMIALSVLNTYITASHSVQDGDCTVTSSGGAGAATFLQCHWICHRHVPSRSHVSIRPRAIDDTVYTFGALPFESDLSPPAVGLYQNHGLMLLLPRSASSFV